MKEWIIAGETVQPGESRQMAVRPFDGYEIPATLINGAEEGKTIIITAGIHSGEYPGVGAVIRLAKQIDPAKLKGRLLLMHCVNTSGFWAKTRGRVPEDGFNLNGGYPGSPDGGAGARIADYFVKQIFPQAEFIIDLHSGGQNEPLTPCLFFPAAAGEHIRNVSLEAAAATNIPNLIASTATTGEYSYAAGMGVPGLLLERGYCGLANDEWIEAYVRDLRLLLDHLGAYEYIGDKSVCEKRIYEKTTYLVADRRGVWYPKVFAGDKVNMGDTIGVLEDMYGNVLKEYLAEADGTVFYHAGGLAVLEGNPLAAYGLEDYAAPYVE